jgi:hypothetical protein
MGFRFFKDSTTNLHRGFGGRIRHPNPDLETLSFLSGDKITTPEIDMTLGLPITVVNCKNKTYHVRVSLVEVIALSAPFGGKQ